MVAPATGLFRTLCFDNLKGAADKRQLLWHITSQWTEFATTGRAAFLFRPDTPGFTGKWGR